MTNQWVELTVPLAGIDLTSVLNPFVFTELSAGNFYFDNVRYVSSAASPFFNVSLLNIADNSPASVITFSTATLAWTMADQYINMELDPDEFSWGVQIYTDNEASDASPKFQTTVPSGLPGSNPSGLIQVSNPSVTLPLAWSIKADTTTPPSATDPNKTADPNSFQWLYMADANTPAIPAANTPQFVNGALVNTVKNNQGINYVQGLTQLGAANPPNAIYLETNLGLSTAPNTYRTTTIRLEYYTP